MKKIVKNKKGFSLTEVVLVIAVIVILAGAFFIGIQDYLNVANAAEADVNASVNNLSNTITDKENDLMSKGF